MISSICEIQYFTIVTKNYLLVGPDVRDSKLPHVDKIFCVYLYDKTQTKGQNQNGFLKIYSVQSCLPCMYEVLK